ncbi:MAG TPA: class I SAM-dependent methyltransferase [Polyangiaceae bacterium]|nr:class I SAM-dependent methyltransferase [Polyangiaceae bacterium]
MTEYFENPSLYFRGRYVVDLRKTLARDLLGELKETRILDLGCGDGTVSLQFLGNGNQLTLADSSRAMLSLVRASVPKHLENTVTLVESALEDLPDQQFDIVICLGVLAHVQSVERAVQKIAASMRPGARCLIQITDHDRRIASLVRLFAGVRHLLQQCGRYEVNVTTRAQLEQCAGNLGLECLESKAYSLGIPGAGRLLSQRVLYKYAELSLRSTMMQPLCSEVLLLFKKQVGHAVLATAGRGNDY